MVLKNYRTLTATQNYTGTATTLTTDLPRDFLIQRILLNFNGTTTLSGTSTLVTDALLKCVKAIRIKAVGEGSSRTIFDVAIPSYLLSTLQLEIEYDTSANGYGTNVSAQDFDMTITLIEGIPEASEDFSSNPLMTVLSKTINGDASTGDEDFDTFFQVGALIRRDFLCTETSASVRASTEINDFSVKSGQIPIMSKIFFDANVNKDIMNYRVSEVWDGLALVEGYTMIDFANNRQPFIPTSAGLKIDGLSTVGYNVGDLVFTADKNNASSILRRVQESVEG